MTEYPLPSRLDKKEAEKRRIEDSCYNYELDLWDTVKLEELAREEEIIKRIRKP